MSCLPVGVSKRIRRSGDWTVKESAVHEDFEHISVNLGTIRHLGEVEGDISDIRKKALLTLLSEKRVDFVLESLFNLCFDLVNNLRDDCVLDQRNEHVGNL